MPEIPDVVQGNPVESAWGNDIRDRTVQRYTDAAARDSLTPLPAPGDLAYLDDTGSVQVYDGTAWRDLLGYQGGRVGALPAAISFDGAPVAGAMQVASFDAARSVLRVGDTRADVGAYMQLLSGDDSGAGGFTGGQIAFRVRGADQALAIDSGANPGDTVVKAQADVVVEQGYWLENRGSIIRQGANTDKVPSGTRVLTLNIPRHSAKLARWVIQVDATFGFETTPVEARLNPVPGTGVTIPWEQTRQNVWCQAAVWAKWTHQLEVEISPGTGDAQVFFDSTVTGGSAYWRASCIAQLSFWND